MTDAGEAILTAALDLSDDDRGHITFALMETLPDDDPALEAELERWRASLPPPDEPPIMSMCLGEPDDAADPAADPLPLTDAGRTLLDAALARPVLDRAIIAEVLHETLPPPPGLVPVTEEEMIAELNRRMEESERDPSSCIPWEQVRDGLWDDLDDPRPVVKRE